MPKFAGFSDYFCLHRKFLVYNLILRNLKLRYRKSKLGILWSVLVPAGTGCIYYFVFSVILKVTVPNYLIFILSGIIPWTFWTTSLSMGIESLVSNHGLLNKVPLPPQALPLADTLTHMLNLVLSLPVLVVAMIVLKTTPTWAASQFILLLIPLFLINYSLNLILAIAYVYFRDLRHIFGLVLQFWFYLTPIMFSTSMIPERYRFGLLLNPIGLIFAGFNGSLADGKWLTGQEWAIIAAWTVVFVAISKWLLNKLRNSIIEIL